MATSTTSASADPSTEPASSSIDGYNVRIIHAATGEIIRQLTIDPERRYHGTGKPIGGPRRPYGPRKNKKPEP